jgi:hypothetical protein
MVEATPVCNVNQTTDQNPVMQSGRIELRSCEKKLYASLTVYLHAFILYKSFLIVSLPGLNGFSG